MKEKNPYKDTDKVQFAGGEGFCWEFDSDEPENFQEEDYGNFLADVTIIKLRCMTRKFRESLYFRL